MSDIQMQIQNAEDTAVKELNVAKQYLEEKIREAERKAKDLFESAQKDSDDAFAAKKEILEKKLEVVANDAVSNTEKEIEKINSQKAVLIKKGTSFLLSRISK